MSSHEPSPEERIAELEKWSAETAEAFRDLAADFGVNLDYSPESLGEVERLITENLTDRRGRVKKKHHDLAGATGAYVTEVILRNLGGKWDWEPEWEVAGIRFSSSGFTAPLAKSRKRYEDGPGDDFVSYYYVLAQQEAEGM
jgi:hypothetical protein